MVPGFYPYTNVRSLLPFHENWLHGCLLTDSLWVPYKKAALVLAVAFFIAFCLLWFDNYLRAPNYDASLFDLRDVALVTGGLGGLGLEIVKELLSRNRIGHIYILDIQEPQTVGSDKVTFVKCDLSSSDALINALNFIYSSLGDKRVTFVVNNAGIRHSGSVLKTTSEVIRKVFEVNTFAVISILQEVVQRHIDRKPADPLCIANVSSILGAFGPKNLLAYSASKAATIQIHECFTQEVSEFPSIRPLLVLPGQLTTDMFKDVIPSRQFFAPLVDHRQLARVIVDRLMAGHVGTLCEPMYANFLPVMKIMPYSVQKIARWASEMDKKIKDQ